MSLGHVDYPLLIFYTYRGCLLSSSVLLQHDLWTLPRNRPSFPVESRLRAILDIDRILSTRSTTACGDKLCLDYIGISWLVDQSVAWKYFGTFRFSFMSRKVRFSMPQYHSYTHLKALLVKYTNFCISCSSWIRAKLIANGN